MPSKPQQHRPAHAIATQQTPRATYDATRRKQDPALAEAARIRSSYRWQQTRKLHRSLYPLCCDPFGQHANLPAYNQQSHHIQPLATHPHLAYDLSNLAPLCMRCHAETERMEQQGRPTTHLFANHQQREAQRCIAIV